MTTNENTDGNSLTFDKLFDAMLKEKNYSLPLKPLPANFYAKVQEFIRATKQAKESVTQIKNILQELQEAREKKILEMAKITSNKGPDIVDTEPLQSSERELYKSLVERLNKQRNESILMQQSKELERAAKELIST